MRYYVKVVDAVAGVGFSRGYWTKRGVLRASDEFREEYGDAVWIVTHKQMLDQIKE